MQIRTIRFAAFLVASLFSLTRVFAQAAAPSYAYRVSIDLQNVTPDRDRIKVTITPPPIQAREIHYVLPAYLPGYANAVDAGRFIHQFYALDDKGFPLKASKKGKNTIVLKMRKGATLKKIEYWVDDTWDEEKTSPRQKEDKFNYIPQAFGTNIDAGNNYVLNHAFIFGYVDGFSEVPYVVTVIKPDELVATTALDVTSETQTRDVYQAANYRQLVDNPVMYCRPDTAGFLAGNIYVSVSVFSENGRVSARLVRRLLASGVTSTANFIPEIGGQNYKMMFYFTTPFKTVLNVHGNYGGLAHAHSAFYFLPELADEDLLAREIERETRGDLLHLLRPLNTHGSLNSGDFLKQQLCSSWWFTEGTNLYFGWLASVRDSFTSEEEFMSAISAKVRLSEMAPKKPVTDLKSLLLAMKVPLKREAVRAKATLLAMLLDIRITELTDGKTGLKELVLQMNAAGTLSPDSLEPWIVKHTDPQIENFFRDFVDGDKPLPMIDYFEKIGWAYAPAAMDSMLTFGRFGLLYDDNLDVFYVHNADSTNLFGLRDGDRIISVNGIIVESDNFDEALHPVYTPKKDEEIEIRFIRKDINMSAKAMPVVNTVLVEHLIRKDPAATEKAIQLHDRLFAPSSDAGT